MSAVGERRPDREELARREVALANELNVLVVALTPEQRELLGYNGEWSVKDLIGHLTGWDQEAADVLRRIRTGTDRPWGRTVDEANQEFYERYRDVPLEELRHAWVAARWRMVQEWWALEGVTPKAEEWFRESGPEHLAEHIPRLREWVLELVRPAGGEGT